MSVDINASDIILLVGSVPAVVDAALSVRRLFRILAKKRRGPRSRRRG